MEALMNKLIELAKAHPGQPVGLIYDDIDGLRVGVLSVMYPDGDDWYYVPVPIADLQKSTVRNVTNKKPHGNAVSDDDPRRTRTYNQLIKSQLLRKNRHVWMPKSVNRFAQKVVSL